MSICLNIVVFPERVLSTIRENEKPTTKTNSSPLSPAPSKRSFKSIYRSRSYHQRDLRIALTDCPTLLDDLPGDGAGLSPFLHTTEVALCLHLKDLTHRSNNNTPCARGLGQKIVAKSELVALHLLRSSREKPSTQFETI